MKIVATTVGRHGPGGERQNQERLEAVNRALEKATKLGADVVALPAGFFSAGNTRAREDIAALLIGTAKKLGIAVVFGIDQEVKSLNADYSWYIRRGGLPSYVYAWSPSGKVTHCWAQRSTNRNNQWEASDKVCQEVRLLMIRDESVAVLICGEIFNQRIREALKGSQPKPKVVVDVAHTGSGFRVFQGMKVLAGDERGLPSVCSVHAQCEYAMKHCYVPPGKRMSSRILDDYVYGPPRIELKLWTF